MRGLFRTITAAFLALCFSWSSEAGQIYMLSKPLEQTTQLTKTGVIAALGVDLSYEAAKAAIVFYFTGNLHAVTGFFVQGLAQEIPSFVATTRSGLQLKAAWNRRKDLQEIANFSGVQNIRVLSAGEMENKGLMKATLHSTSTIFIESEGELPPAYQGKDWVKVTDLEGAKVRMTLKIENQSVGSSIEIPLKELFKGTELDNQVRSEWISGIEKWKKDFPVWKRYNPMNHLDKGLAIDTSLIMNGSETHIGKSASGKAVNKLLGNTLTRKILSYVQEATSLELLPTNGTIATKNSVVLEPTDVKTDCRHFYERLSGKRIIRASPP